jgi:hypothetical protein
MPQIHKKSFQQTHVQSFCLLILNKPLASRRDKEAAFQVTKFNPKP